MNWLSSILSILKSFFSFLDKKTLTEEEKIARIITWSGSLKARLLEKENLIGTISQVDGGRWVTFEGTCSVTNDPQICADAVSRYAVRYSPPKDRGSDRRTISMVVSKILLSTGLAS